MCEVFCHGRHSRHTSKNPEKVHQPLAKSMPHTPVIWELFSLLRPEVSTVLGIYLYMNVSDHVFEKSFECPE